MEIMRGLDKRKGLILMQVLVSSIACKEENRLYE